jgi:hypothetical protein
MNIYGFSIEAKKSFERCPMTQPSDFCMVQDDRMFSISFRQQRLELVMIKSMRSDEVHSRQAPQLS